jgi:predicted nucleic acid-binding protein
VIFVDTGAFLARYLARDQHHEDAVRAWKRAREERLFTSNLVLAETFTLLARWAGGSFAAERAMSILQSERMAILRPGAAEELEAVPGLEKYADQRVSFTDCVSFVLMRKQGVQRAFSFDRHFVAAGFRLWP